MSSAAEGWKRDAAARALKLYPGGANCLGALLAQVDRYAIQYIEQCPALIAFVISGMPLPDSGRGQGLLVNRFSQAIHGYPKLGVVLERLHGLTAVRRIEGQACYPSNFPVIFQLRTISPSVLAQAIPYGVARQRDWLSGLGQVMEYQAKMPFRPGGEVWKWAVPAYGEAIQVNQRPVGRRRHAQPAAQALTAVLDMIRIAGQDRLQPSWTLWRAEQEAQRWHDELTRERTEKAVVEGLGFAFDHRFPCHLPERVEIDGFEFVTLCSGEELFQEGIAMRHCVATYIRQVAAGSSYVVSMRRDGRRVATLELQPHGSATRLVQLQGGKGARLTSVEIAAAEFYAGQVRQRSLRTLEERGRSFIGQVMGGLDDGHHAGS